MKKFKKLVICKKTLNPYRTGRYFYSLRFVDCSKFEDSVYDAEYELEQEGVKFESRLDKMLCAAEQVMYSEPLDDYEEWVVYGFILVPENYKVEKHYYGYGREDEEELECNPDPLKIVGGDNGKPKIVFNGEPVNFNHADAYEILKFIMGPEELSALMAPPRDLTKKMAPMREQNPIYPPSPNAADRPPSPTEMANDAQRASGFSPFMERTPAGL